MPRTPLEAIAERWADPQLFSRQVHYLHRSGQGQNALELFRRDSEAETDPVRKALRNRLARSPYLWLDVAAPPAEWRFPFVRIEKRLGAPWYPDDEWKEHQYQVRTLAWVLHVWAFVQYPVWPISTWITSFGTDGVSHYGPARFAARTPGWWASSASLVGLAAAVATPILWFLLTPHTTVWAHNGYGFPVHVTVGDESRVVPAHGHWRAGLFRDGPVSFAARRSPEEPPFDAAEVQLRGGISSWLVYNVNERGGLRVKSVEDAEEPPVWLGTDALLYPSGVSYLFPEPRELEDPWVGARMVESVPEESSGGGLALRLGREIGVEHGLRVARAVLELEPEDAEARGAVEQLLAGDPERLTAFFASLPPGSAGADP